jgi:hypothetical protein
VPRALPYQLGTVHEKRGVVEPARRPARDAFGDGHGHEAALPGRRDRVADQGASRPQHPAHLTDDPGQVGDVLEDFACDDHIREAVRERQAARIGGHDVDTVGTGDAQGRQTDVDAEMPVRSTRDVFGQQPAAARDVEQHRSRPRRWQ